MNIRQLKKKFNYKLIEYQKKKKTGVVIGYPYWLTIDPSSICTLKCVCCPTGQDNRNARPRAVMSYEQFKRIIDVLGPYLLFIDFCNWGEPLHNKEICKIISYAGKYGIPMKISTNLNVALTEQDAEGLVKSGLTMLTMSVDGASQKTYEIYRRGGDFSQVIENMKLLVRKKKELGVDQLHLDWQFLVFKHNEHEIEMARALSRIIGVDTITFTAPFCSKEMASSIEEFNKYQINENTVVYKKEAVRETCNWLWDAITINADCSISPCCSVEDAKDDFDNFFSKPFCLLWNTKKYRYARKYIRDGLKPRQENICTVCNHIGASNHAEKKY